MNKDEMKNRISLALKDPILQQGFEIICKDLAELEKKLTEKVTLESLDVVSAKIKGLEKENAELKEYNKYLKRQRQGGIQKQYNKVRIIKQQDEQLTKAKEIITALLNVFVYDLADDEMDTGDVDTKIKAEQFLKDSEVEK